MLKAGWASKRGVYDLVCASASSRWAKAYSESGWHRTVSPFEGLLGPVPWRRCFAMVHGTLTQVRDNLRTVAQVSVKNHYHSQFNPKAMYQKEASLAESHGRGDDCLSQHEAHVFGQCGWRRSGRLGLRKRAKQLGLMARAVRIAPPYLLAILTLSEISLCTTSTPAPSLRHDRRTKLPNLARGFGPCRIARLFATAEIVHYENLGLAEEGNGAELLESRANIQWGTNSRERVRRTASKGHPLGATGIANVWRSCCPSARRKQGHAK